MFAADCNAHDFIALGECMVVLRNPRVWNARNYLANRQELVRRLRLSVFQSTLAAAERLDACSIRETPMQTIDPNDTPTLEAMAQTVYSVLSHESKQATVLLTDFSPPDALTNLETRLGRKLETHQKALQQDLITCLRAHLPRPAIVMAWALGYDVIRSWVFDDKDQRLPAFNMQLAGTRRQGEPTAIVDYHDFFRIGEYRFLGICRDSQDPSLQRFTDKHFRELHGMLDRRNEFAHANYHQASDPEATVFVEQIIRIVTNPPFVS